MWAASPATVDVERDGAAYVVRAEVELRADLRSTWFTVTDYERLPQFVPGLRSVRVLARAADGDSERLLVEQRGEFRFLWFTQPVLVWLDVQHKAPRQVLARSVLPSGVNDAKSTLREFEGSYELASIDAAQTRLTYRARIEPAQPLLPLIGTLAVRHTVDAQFRALAAEIERRAAAATTRQAAR